MDRWLAIIKLVVPIVLGTVNPALAPLGAIIVHGIGAAQQMPGATGAQKLATVVDLATSGAQGINAAVGHVLVDPALVQATAAEAISASVQMANLIHSIPVVAVGAPATLTPPPPQATAQGDGDPAGH